MPMIVTPWTRRTIVEPLWAAASGTRRLREWQELEHTQYLPLEALRDRQSERLRALVRAAVENTPFYSDWFTAAGVAPSAISTPDDLRRLPIVTKQHLRREGGRMLSKAFAPTALMEFRTGGSTGKPLVLFASEEVSERRNACARRSDRWSGWEVGEPVAAVWGNPKLPSTLKERLRNELLEPIIYLDTMALTPDAVRRFAVEWRQVRPTLLFGHAHSIYLLARSLEDQGIDDVRPKAVLSTSMMLLKPERDVIERVLSVKVTDRYGCEEVGLIGCECERHNGLHMNLDHLIVEFLREDGTTADAGEMAYVVVTDLINDAMPLIRYRVEDMACRIDRACECGRALPLMDRVAGRVADFLLRGDGARVAGISLIENSLTKFSGIDQMQIVQDDLTHIHLRIVPDPAFDAGIERELTGYFAETFPGTTVQVERVETIPREPNGKYRFAICRIES
jgi:phenylacetate-CoA ligase